MNLPLRTLLRTLLRASLVSVLGCSTGSEPSQLSASLLKVEGGQAQTGAVAVPLLTPVVFLVSDASGHGVGGVLVSFSASGNGSASPASAMSDASGHVTTRWTLSTTAGTNETLIATAPGIAPATANALATPGPVAGLAFSLTPGQGALGQPLGGFTMVEVRDAYGNRPRMSGIPVTLRLAVAANNLLTGATQGATGVDGTASFPSATITGKANTVTLVAESAGLSPASTSLTMNPGDVARIDILGGTTVLAAAGGPGPALSVQLSDTWGNVTPGVKVIFGVTGAAVLGEATTGTDGIATLNTWVAPVTGIYQVTVSARTVSSVLTLTTQPGAPAFIVPSQSNPTTGTVGLAAQMGVVVQDAQHNPVPGAIVNWSVTSTTGKGSLTSGLNGAANFTAFLPQKAGMSQIVVTSGNASLTILVQANAGAVVAIKPVKDTVDGAAGATVNVDFVAVDLYSNPVPGVTILSSQNGLLSPPTLPASAITGSDGIARFPVTMGPLASQGVLNAVYEGNPTKVGWTFLYTTATTGTLWVRNSCPTQRGLSVPADVRLFDSGGRYASGVPVTVSVAPGNGQVYGANLVKVQNFVAASDAVGYVSVGWTLPNQAGTYHLTVSASNSYALSPSTIDCVAQ